MSIPTTQDVIDFYNMNCHHIGGRVEDIIPWVLSYALYTKMHVDNHSGEFVQGEGKYYVSPENRELYDKFSTHVLLAAKTWAVKDSDYIASKIGADRAFRFLLSIGAIQDPWKE